MRDYTTLWIYIIWELLYHIVGIFDKTTIYSKHWIWRVRPNMHRIVSKHNCIMNYARKCKLDWAI